MYESTITLFNFHKATGLWYTSVFSGVDLGVNKASKSTTDGKMSGDTITAIIPCGADKTFVTSDGAEKGYMGPKEYARCENPADHITFNPERDFIYEGAWSEPSPISEDGKDTGLYHSMNDEHDGVYMITSAAFYSLLPHFEIGGQ